MRKLAIRTFIAGIFAAIAVIGVWIFTQHNATSELARYKAELVAKGEKLKVSEYIPARSTNAEEIASRDVFQSNDLAEVQYETLIWEYTGPGKLRVAWRGELHADETDENIPKATWEMLEAEDRTNAAQLQKFLEALKAPPPDTGWVYADDFTNMIDSPGPPMAVVIRVREILAQETLLALHQGRLEAAISHLISFTRMAQTYRNEPEFEAIIARCRAVQEGIWATWQALQATNWSESDLADVQKGWEGVRLYVGLELIGEYNRTQSMLTLETVRKYSAFDVVPASGTLGARIQKAGVVGEALWRIRTGMIPYIYRGLDRDEEALLRYWTDEINAVRLLNADRPVTQVTNITVSAQGRIEKQLAGGSEFRKSVIELVSSHFSSILPKLAETEGLRRLGITAIAIKRYQLKHGSPPPNLEALTPDYLAAVPVDPMSGKPLCYRLNADRTFVLYSVGFDGRDDGGDPTPAKAEDKPGLWEGRDAVWPTAATPAEQDAADRAAK